MGSTTHPFTVDGYLVLGVEGEFTNFGDVADAFHVGGVAACAKDAGNLGSRIDVVRGDQGPRRIARQGHDLSGDVLHQRLAFDHVLGGKIDARVSRDSS